MAHRIPTSEPADLRVGETWTWLRADLVDYPASTWTLIYYFKNAAGSFTITASADGDAFLIVVAPSTTATYTAGRYDWQARVTDGSAIHTVHSGVLEVAADFSVAGAYDGRSLPRKLLDAVNAILENRATEGDIDAVATAIGDRSATRNPTFLIEYRSKLEQEVKRVENSGGLTRIVTRFANG